MLRATRAAMALIGSGGFQQFAYLAVTVAVTVAAWLVLTAMASPFLTVVDTQGNDHLRVTNARNQSTPLPLAYAERLGALQGVKYVTWLDLQMLVCGDDTVTVSAVGGNGVAYIPEIVDFDAEVLRRWQNDPIGLLVSRAAAKACEWKVGQGIEPLDVRGRPLAFHVIGIADDPNQGMTGLAHYVYVNRAQSLVAGRDRVLRYRVVAEGSADNQALAARIDAHFSADDPRVVAMPDTAREDARSRFGKVQNLLALVMGAVVACCLLVTVSVMSHATAQRRQQMGLMRALGFPRRVLALAFVLEVLGILLAGSGLGIAVGIWLVEQLPRWLEGQFQLIAQPGWTWQILPLWLLAVGAVTLIYPCLVAMSIRPVDGRMS